MFHSVLPPKKHQSQLQLTVQSIDIFTNFLHELDDATKNWDKEQSNISVETDTIPWRGSMFQFSNSSSNLSCINYTTPYDS
jgi:hypothetical protein